MLTCLLRVLRVFALLFFILYATIAAIRHFYARDIDKIFAFALMPRLRF